MRAVSPVVRLPPHHDNQPRVCESAEIYQRKDEGAVGGGGEDVDGGGGGGDAERAVARKVDVVEKVHPGAGGFVGGFFERPCAQEFFLTLTPISRP